MCVLCDFDVCTYRFNEFASFCRRLIKIHSEKTVALPPKPKPNSNLTCKTESTRVPVYVCLCVCVLGEREREIERAYATESTKRSRGRVEPLNKRGNKHKSESEESLRPIQCVPVSLPVSPNRSLSLFHSLIYLHTSCVCVCWCRQRQFKEFVWPQANLQHPPTSAPSPPPATHTHTLSCCRPWHRHQTLHNFRRPSASAQYAGRPVVWTVCPCPCVRVSLCPLWSPGLAVWTHFQSVYVKTSTVTLRHAETLRAEASALCVVQCFLSRSLSLSSTLLLTLALKDREAFLLSRGKFEFQRENQL